MLVTPPASNSHPTPNASPRQRLFHMPLLALLPISLCACGSDSGGQGTVQVFVEPEDSITDGLTAGDGEEQVVDGWNVEYDRFVATIGRVRASRSDTEDMELLDERVFVVDLQAVPAAGLTIAEFESVDATRFQRFGFDMPNADEDSLRADGTGQADFDEMVEGGYSLIVEGRIYRDGGMACRPTAPDDCIEVDEVRFEFRISAGTSFDDCAAESGDSGFAVPAGGTVQVKPTIHGDHWFFSDITQGAERTERRAQWVANADLDRDGLTTTEELADTMASDLFTPEHYNLTGAISPIVTGLDYLVAQAHTLGDFQGSGECPTREALP